MKTSLSLFEGYGVELEYMIVNKDDLSVNPIADEVIKKIAGEYTSDVELGEIGWSNELVLHVIELKTNGPRKSLDKLDNRFQENVNHINEILKKHNSVLLPTGAHPFMNPFTETKLWPHEYNAVYESYDRIFGCKGHGWSNLQSTHINLPFANDEEFGRLHAAIRLLLPIMPALSASTPIIDRKPTGIIDTRLEVYRLNQKKIPSLAGLVIPERAFSESEYEDLILKKLYKDIEPYDTEDILKYEWLNSRGAIARFDRNTIEIRIIDIQECPTADLAVVDAIVETLKKLISEEWVSYADQKLWDENQLSKIFLDVIKFGEEAEINDLQYLKLFGFNCDEGCRAKDLWNHIADNIFEEDYFSNNEVGKALNVILTEGSLSARIIKQLNNNFSSENITELYRKLAVLLSEGKMLSINN